VVVTISNPRLEGQNLTYDVKTLEGDLPKAGGAAALFIDVIVVRRAPVRPTVVVEARHAALRSLSHSSMKAENSFQLQVLGVTGKTRDSDFGQRPLVRCGLCVSPARTLVLARVQDWERVGVPLDRASLEVPFGRCQLLHGDPWRTGAQAGARRLRLHRGLLRSKAPQPRWRHESGGRRGRPQQPSQVSTEAG